MSQLLTASLPDGRLQVWFIDEVGKLISRSQTSAGVDAPWTDWTDFPSPSMSGVKSIAAGALPANHRLLLWAVDNMNTIWSTSQEGTDWTDWTQFPSPEPASNIEAIGVAALADGRLQLWVIRTLTEVWIRRMVKQNIDAGWTNWAQL